MFRSLLRDILIMVKGLFREVLILLSGFTSGNIDNIILSGLYFRKY